MPRANRYPHFAQRPQQHDNRSGYARSGGGNHALAQNSRPYQARGQARGQARNQGHRQRGGQSGNDRHDKRGHRNRD